MRWPAIFCVFFLASSGSAQPVSGPDEVVRSTVAELAELVSACRLQLAADPVAVRGLIEQRLRPRADVLFAARRVLGRHWRDASPEQRRRFADALYGTLVNRYASGLLLLTRDNVQVPLPGAGGRPGGDEALAEVELRIRTGLPEPVSVFLQARRNNGQWRIYDARWEDQSYVLSLRDIYADPIRSEGLGAVIRRLEASAGSPPGAPEARQTLAGRCLRAAMTD